MEDAEKSNGREGPDEPSFWRLFQQAIEREFCSQLMPMLQMPVAARWSGLTWCDAQAFWSSVEEPTCCLPLSGETVGETSAESVAASPAREAVAGAWAELSPQITFAILDRLLGGSGKDCYIPNRPLTAIERRLLRRVVDKVAACTRRCWDGPSPAGGDAGGPVAVARFSLTMGHHAGAMRICLPASMAPAASRDGGEGRAAGGEARASRLDQSPLELSVIVDDPAVRLDELAGLEVDDVIVTDLPADAEVIVRVAGIPKFYAALGAADGRRAVRITRRYDGAAEK